MQETATQEEIPPLELGRKGMDIVSPGGGRRGHKKSASCSMSPSLQRYLADLASIQEKEIDYTDQKFKSHVGHYKLVKSIGQGSGGEVFLARHAKTGEKAAIKIVRKSSKHPHWERMVRQENSTMQYLARFPEKDSKHIIRPITTKENDKEIAIVMEYAHGGDLFELIKRRGKLPESEAWRIFRQLIRAVKFIHGKRICHRDIQPCNIFLDKDHNVLLGDWGHSKSWTPYETSQENCGSLCYAAPEVFLADKQYVGPEIDLWSCGTVLYVMLSGQRPFWSSNRSDIYQNIQAGRYKKLPDYLSPEVSHLLSILLSTDPLKRATMLDVLNHPWMKRHPARARRSDSSPFLLSPSGNITARRQPHPLLIARRTKGVSCEQLDLSAFRASTSIGSGVGGSGGGGVAVTTSTLTSSLISLQSQLIADRRHSHAGVLQLKEYVDYRMAQEEVIVEEELEEEEGDDSQEDGSQGSSQEEGDLLLESEGMMSPPSQPAAETKLKVILQSISSSLAMCDGHMVQQEGAVLAGVEY